MTDGFIRLTPSRPPCCFPAWGGEINKARFGLVGLYLRLTNDWRQLERYTVDSWMRKWAGDRVYELMWQPLMVGKFGPYHQEVNMAWMWARLKSRTTRLGSFQAVSRPLRRIGRAFA